MELPAFAQGYLSFLRMNYSDESASPLISRTRNDQADTFRSVEAHSRAQ